MRKKHLFAVVWLSAAPVLAGPEILPVSGTGYATYNEATGEIIQQAGPQRHAPVWNATQIVGLLPLASDETGLDWGDIAGPATIHRLSFTNYTNSQADDGDLWALIQVYEEENGWNSTDRVCVRALLITNIPGSTYPPDEYWGYIWAVELSQPFVLDGSDLDGDGLVDFGYSLHFSVNTPGAVHGPAIAAYDPNAAPGADEWYDLFRDGNYVDTYSLEPFHQLYWAMYAASSCPDSGDSGRYCEADIDGSYDCRVGLADLAALLGNYGCGTPEDPNCVATLLMGDVDPYDEWFPGDGDVDLADLSELLMQYGDDCNGP